MTFKRILIDVAIAWPIVAALVYLARTPSAERDLVLMMTNICTGTVLLSALILSVLLVTSSGKGQVNQ